MSLKSGNGQQCYGKGHRVPWGMKSMYPSYIRAFEKFAQDAIDSQTFCTTLSWFALSISEKANELITRAGLNLGNDLPRLQKEMFALGRDYIHRFANTARQKKKALAPELSLAAIFNHEI